MAGTPRIFYLIIILSFMGSNFSTWTEFGPTKRLTSTRMREENTNDRHNKTDKAAPGFITIIARKSMVVLGSWAGGPEVAPCNVCWPNRNMAIASSFVRASVHIPSNYAVINAEQTKSWLIFRRFAYNGFNHVLCISILWLEAVIPVV